MPSTLMYFASRLDHGTVACIRAVTKHLEALKAVLRLSVCFRVDKVLFALQRQSLLSSQFCMFVLVHVCFECFVSEFGVFVFLLVCFLFVLICFDCFFFLSVVLCSFCVVLGWVVLFCLLAVCLFA